MGLRGKKTLLVAKVFIPLGMAQNPLWRCSHVCSSRLSQKVFNCNKDGWQRKGIRI